VAALLTSCFKKYKQVRKYATPLKNNQSQDSKDLMLPALYGTKN